MSLRARVGRHTLEGGRQCQNWADDQQKITDLLNRIGLNEGGAAGNLKAPIRSGFCGDALYSAILKFENKHSPAQRRGYVDPGGAMWKRMADLGGGTTLVVETGRAVLEPETKLDILRRNVLAMPSAVTRIPIENWWTAGDRVQLDRLVQVAVQHIESLQRVTDQAGNHRENLPSWGQVFGMVYVGPDIPTRYTREDLVTYRGVGPALRLQTKFGSPLGRRELVVAGALPALLLFNNGVCYPMKSNEVVRADDARQDAAEGWFGKQLD
jgi:hypothetical protein